MQISDLKYKKKFNNTIKLKTFLFKNVFLAKF